MFEVNDAYSLWKDIFYGVPQDSILSTLLFNIHLFDLFYFLKDLDMTQNNNRHELKFDDNVNYLCKKDSQKFNALARIAQFMNVSKKRVIMKSFIELHFGYCPLI